MSDTPTSLNALERRYFKGEMLFREGTTGDNVFEIVSGSVLVFKKGPGNQRVSLAKLSEGDILGEMFLLHKSNLRNASAVALNDVMVRVYSGEKLFEELSKIDPHYQKLLLALTRKLQKMNNAYICNQNQEDTP